MGVQEKYRDGPEGHELVAALGQTVVAGPPLAAAGTDRPAVGSFADKDFDDAVAAGAVAAGAVAAGAVGAVGETRLGVNKGGVFFNAIEDSLKEHPVFLRLGWS